MLLNEELSEELMEELDEELASLELLSDEGLSEELASLELLLSEDLKELDETLLELEEAAAVRENVSTVSEPRDCRRWKTVRKAASAGGMIVAVNFCQLLPAGSTAIWERLTTPVCDVMRMRTELAAVLL